MNELSMTNLELQIEALLQDRQQLMFENSSLRKKLFKLTQERSILQKKSQVASQKIKRVITQLRSDVHERVS